MEIRDLRCALAALDAGSFARAAASSYVSRQALSQTVRRLEDEVGIELFEVAGNNRLKVTPEGAIFLAQARPVVEAFDDFARAYPSLASERGAALTLAMATGVALSLPARFFSDFAERAPQLVQEIEETNTESALALLDSARVDVALVGSCPSMLPSSRYERAFLVATGLWLAIPCSNPLARRDHLELADLDGQRLVTAGRLNHLHRYIAHACEQRGVNLEIPASSSNNELLVRLARESDALFFTFPERITHPASGSGARPGAARDVENPTEASEPAPAPPDRTPEFAVVELVTAESRAFGTYAVRRRDSRRTPAARQFWAYACERAEKGLPEGARP